MGTELLGVLAGGGRELSELAGGQHNGVFAVGGEDDFVDVLARIDAGLLGEPIDGRELALFDELLIEARLFDFFQLQTDEDACVGGDGGGQGRVDADGLLGDGFLQEIGTAEDQREEETDPDLELATLSSV